MVTLEQVEKLRQYASISYEEAKAALEETNGDILLKSSHSSRPFNNSLQSNYQRSNFMNSATVMYKPSKRLDSLGEAIKYQQHSTGISKYFLD